MTRTAWSSASIACLVGTAVADPHLTPARYATMV